MKKVLVVGAGQGGMAIIQLFKQNQFLKITAIVDTNPNAPGMVLARQEGIPSGEDWHPFLNETIDIIFDVTGDPEVFQDLKEKKPERTTLIPGEIARILVELVNEKVDLIQKLKMKTAKDELIFSSIHDGMIAIDQRGIITTFNRAAEQITGIKRKDAIGKSINAVIPTTGLLSTIRNKRAEINQEMLFPNGKKAITTRIPIIDEDGKVLGAFSVFKDITELVNLASEITNLKEIQTMLEAIIHSSNDAISVVDEDGKGILINPAYTKLTGLSEEDVIGKPATIDIYEGKSMHYHVLKTKQPVRGVKMVVGPKKKEVVVNVAPIIVEGKLKGSVGVIHDVSEIRELTKELERAKERIRTLEAKYTFEDIVGKSEELLIAIEQAKIGAKTPATVLLRGESGTGKELFAHAIHNESDRKYNKFVRVNCAALTESLLESELFGYEEGAFSGAKRGGKRGLFEEANHGSIFLDEIGELSPNMQAKLLRVLQEKEIVRVGGTRPIAIDVRIIAATNVNLEMEVTKGKFREDLYYRLNRIPIHIPPLRDRLDDIPDLCERLIQKINNDYGKHVFGITEEAIEILKRYDWPGNVRELENILGRAIIFMDHNDNYIDARHLPDLVPKEPLSEKIGKQMPAGKLETLLSDFERRVILQTLQKNAGNRTRTAQQLGISIRSLYYKMEKYHIDL